MRPGRLVRPGEFISHCTSVSLFTSADDNHNHYNVCCVDLVTHYIHRHHDHNNDSHDCCRKLGRNNNDNYHDNNHRSSCFRSWLVELCHLP